MVITAHFIDKKWKLQSLIIDFIQIWGAHTGENIRKAFIEGLENFNIQTKVSLFFYFILFYLNIFNCLFNLYQVMEIMTDNTSNNKTFIQSMTTWAREQVISFNTPINHFSCFAHILNLCVQEILDVFKEKLLKISFIK